MKPEVKTAWVEALRSGEYTQGTEMLLQPGVGYCCLGVLCDLAVKSGEIEDLTFENGIVRVGERASNAELIDAVSQWAGLVGVNPVVVFEGEAVPISEVNDGGLPLNAYDHDNDEQVYSTPQPFSVIADLIEAQL